MSRTMTKDAELKEKVERELEFEARIDAAHVGVSVTKGVATLTGTVASLRAKEAAEEATRRVRGIRGVVEELEVELEPADLRKDRSREPTPGCRIIRSNHHTPI